MQAVTKQLIIIVVSSLVLNSIMYSLSVYPLNYAADISKPVGNKLNTQTNRITDTENYKSSRCEIVHVGIVCTSYKYSVYLHTTLKSLFFYRTNPIHFHIMVNDASKDVLKTLFQTWAVPQVAVTFYDTHNYSSEMRWIPNTAHYSGKYGLFKLMFPKVVPLSVTNKLIVIDAELIFNEDIYELWNFFNDFNKHQAIGLVEQQNDYYLGLLHESHPWPALGKGFNSGIILYHLEHLKYIEWEQLWTKIAKQTLPSAKLKYSDQDILNVVVSKQLSLWYTIPCQWNVQLAHQTDSYQCYKNSKVKLVNWNFPEKSKIENKDAEYFKSLYKTFVDYNGNLLRQQFLYNCASIIKRKAQKKFPDSCEQYRQAQVLKRRVLLFAREFKHTPHKYDVTFVSQLSREKIKLVEELSKRWSGPISLTLYITDTELQDCLNFIEKSEILQKRYNIAYHVVFKEGDYYPINELRNTALRNVVTPYVFLVDLDLLPRNDLYKELQTSVRRMKNMHKMALVVPAFESEKNIPQNKTKLLRQLDKKKIFPFHYSNAPQGHNQTNYDKWKTAKAPYYVQWAPYFEPYIVVKRNVVQYDTSFVGFGWNKVSHIMELVAQKYKFLVLTNSFLVHKNHPDSNDLQEYKNLNTFYKCVTNRMNVFVEKINKMYGITFDSIAVN